MARLYLSPPPLGGPFFIPCPGFPTLWRRRLLREMMPPMPLTLYFCLFVFIFVTVINQAHDEGPSVSYLFILQMSLRVTVFDAIDNSPHHILLPFVISSGGLAPYIGSAAVEVLRTGL